MGRFRSNGGWCTIVRAGCDHLVRLEVECVRHPIPVGQHRDHIVIDRFVRILVYRRPHSSKIPACLGIEEKRREVERRGRGDHEERAFTRGVLDGPLPALGQQESVLSTSAGENIGVRVLRHQEIDAPLRTHAKDRHMGVSRDPVVDPHFFAGLNDRALAPIQPDRGFERVRRLPVGIELCGNGDHRRQKHHERQ
jgi:hypothetical protein